MSERAAPGLVTGAAPGVAPGVAVFGAGAWGTALAVQAARAGATATLWARSLAAADAIRAAGENPRLPGVPLGSVRVTADAAEALRGASLLVLAVPAQHLRETLHRLPASLPPVLVAAKGVEAGTLHLPLEVLAETHPGSAAAVLSGPNFAHEVAAGLPAASVVASADPGAGERAVALLSTHTFRLYASADPVGVQVCGAAKNVVAIAAGAAMGAGLGENSRAALVSRALAEIARLAAALGGRPETAAGLSGMGDLLLTCTGAGSRNHALGAALGRGATPAEALAGSRGVVEGVFTAPALLARAAAVGVEMPVCAAVGAVLAGSLSVREAVSRLLERPRGAE